MRLGTWQISVGYTLRDFSEGWKSREFRGFCLFLTYLLLYFVLLDLRDLVVFCNLNVHCSLSRNANKLPVCKLLILSCIFISDGQKRILMLIFKTKRKISVLLYTSNPPIKEIKCHIDTNKENLWEYIKHNQIAPVADISIANILLLGIPKSLWCFSVIYAYWHHKYNLSASYFYI